MKEYKKEYKITGFVYGNLWGGSKGAYPSTTLSGNNINKLLKKANEMLKDKSLDSGMGYESLIGALLTIKTTTTILVKGKEFKNDEYEDKVKVVGKLSNEEIEFLVQCGDNN